MDTTRTPRTRCGQTLGGGALAVVLAVALLLAGCSGPAPTEQDPSSTSPSPAVDLGRPAAAPWVEDDVLHAGSAAVRFLPWKHRGGRPWDSLDYAQGVTVASLRVAVGRHRLVRIEGDTVRTVARRRVPRSSFPWEVDLSADGRWLAYVEGPDVRPRTLHLVDFRGGPRGRASQVRLPAESSVVSVTADGLVVLGVAVDGRASVASWRPGEPGLRPVRTEDDDLGIDLAPGGWPGGLVLADPVRVAELLADPSAAAYPVELESTYGTVGDDGRFEPLGTLVDADQGAWSPDGAHLLRQPVGGYEITVERPGDRAQEALPLPEPPADPLLVLDAVQGWDSPTEVLVMVGGTTEDGVVVGEERQVRCDVVALTCAYTAGGPPAGASAVRLDDV